MSLNRPVRLLSPAKKAVRKGLEAARKKTMKNKKEMPKNKKWGVTTAELNC